MLWIVTMMLALTSLAAAPAAEQTKVPQSWDVQSIRWQKVDADGSK
jgi:hypothetical protein